MGVTQEQVAESGSLQIPSPNPVYWDLTLKPPWVRDEIWDCQRFVSNPQVNRSGSSIWTLVWRETNWKQTFPGVCSGVRRPDPEDFQELPGGPQAESGQESG